MHTPNILLVVPRLNIGGAESYVATLARSLKRRGHHVVVASWGGHWVKLLEAEGIRHYLIPIRLNISLAAWLLGRVIRRENIQLIHANSAAAGHAVYPVSQKYQLPWVMTAHGVFHRGPKDRAMEHAARVICVSDFTRRELRTRTDVPENKFIVIHNGIDVREFSPKGSRDFLRQIWNFAKNDFVVAVVARIFNTHGKGHDALLEAMTLDKDSSWKLLIIGKGKAEYVLKCKVKQLKLEDRVVFAGHRTDVANVLEAADVVALPSEFENFPLAMLEAMAMGKPVVAYDIGGVSEAIEDGCTGFLARPGDTAALAAHINKLQCNPELAATIAAQGRERIFQMFDSEKMVDTVTALYRQVLAEHEAEVRQ